MALALTDTGTLPRDQREVYAARRTLLLEALDRRRPRQDPRQCGWPVPVDRRPRQPDLPVGAAPITIWHPRCSWRLTAPRRRARARGLLTTDERGAAASRIRGMVRPLTPHIETRPGRVMRPGLARCVPSSVRRAQCVAEFDAHDARAGAMGLDATCLRAAAEQNVRRAPDSSRAATRARLSLAGKNADERHLRRRSRARPASTTQSSPKRLSPEFASPAGSASPRRTRCLPPPECAHPWSALPPTSGAVADDDALRARDPDHGATQRARVEVDEAGV